MSLANNPKRETGKDAKWETHVATTAKKSNNRNDCPRQASPHTMVKSEEVDDKMVLVDTEV